MTLRKLELECSTLRKRTFLDVTKSKVVGVFFFGNFAEQNTYKVGLIEFLSFENIERLTNYKGEINEKVYK
jgi:hypothetical protein